MAAADKAVQQGNLPVAEYLLWEALKLAEYFGPESAQVMDTAQRLGDILLRQSKFQDAEDLLLRLAQMLGSATGSGAAANAETLLKLAELYYAQGKYEQAEPFGLRALRTYETMYGNGHIKTCRIAGNVAYIFHAQNKTREAEELYKRAISAKTKDGRFDAESLNIIRSYSSLLISMHREEEASHMMRCVEGLESGNWQVYQDESEQLT